LPYPDLSTLEYPSVSFDRGSIGTLTDNSSFDGDAFIDNVACIASPFCNDPLEEFITIDVSLQGFERPTLAFDRGTFPTWVPGERPEIDFSALIDPQLRTTAYGDMIAITNWAIENGIEVYTALDPWVNQWLQDPQYWNNIAKVKDGGVTYASKGADYAEWLEKEDINQIIDNGQIVGVKNGKISLNTDDADQVMAISVMPVVIGNMPDTTRQEDFEKVAFIGQTPVWVVGTVESGDFIIASGKNDGFGIAISPDELALEHVSKIVGKAWEESNKVVNLVNVAVGLKTNDVVSILQQTEKNVTNLSSRLDKLEQLVSDSNLAEN
jgi:hypothetical protein